MNQLELDQIQQTLSRHGYEYRDYIGKGSFSNVFLCHSKKYNQQFAVKRSTKRIMSKFEYSSLVFLDHPNIIKLYDAFEDENAQYLVMEFCQNGTLRQISPLTYDKFIYYAKKILDAIAFCHRNNIAHRDIKPDNIFIDQYNQIKLADFGLSKQFNENRKSNEKCGSLIFLAPEIIHYYEVCPFKADIWALGITFYYLSSGKYPFQSKSHDELKNEILFGEIKFESSIDQRIQFLIQKMLNKSAKSRLSAEKLLKLPIFSPSFPRKSSLLFDSSRRMPYTTGYSNQSSPLFNKAINHRCCSPDNDVDQKQIPTTDILSYRNININPNMQRIAARCQTTKPS